MVTPRCWLDSDPPTDSFSFAAPSTEGISVLTLRRARDYSCGAPLHRCTGIAVNLPGDDTGHEERLRFS